MSSRWTRREWLKASGVLAAGTWGPSLARASETKQAAAAPPAALGEVVFQRSVPVRHDVDVFIAGGGPAGFAAALGARSQNASVYLAEAHSCLGGMCTAARVPLFMQFGDGVNFLAGDVGRQVLSRLKKESHHIYEGNDIEALKRTYDDLLCESGARFTFYTGLIGVECREGRIAHVVCSAPSGLFAVRAKVYIDATGNGDLAAWAGAHFEKGDEHGELMPGTLCSVWTGIDWETWLPKRTHIPQPDGAMLEKAFADGVFTVHDQHLTGMYRNGKYLGGGNIGHTFGVDGTDEVSITKALLWGRKSLKEFERYYRDYLPGFKNIELVATGSLLGVRETRRIMGDYVLSLDDYKRRATFADEIGRFCYPIDNHPLHPGKDTYEKHRQEMDYEYHYKNGESYGIPYRALIPRGLDNVLVAGRCISADRMVHGSIRVTGGCYITGTAAGAAAAMAASQAVTTRQIDTRDLQQRLKKLGAYLPSV